jgi:hypothetical protein
VSIGFRIHIDMTDMNRHFLSFVKSKAASYLSVCGVQVDGQVCEATSVDRNAVSVRDGRRHPHAGAMKESDDHADYIAVAAVPL